MFLPRSALGLHWARHVFRTQNPVVASALSARRWSPNTKLLLSGTGLVTVSALSLYYGNPHLLGLQCDSHSTSSAQSKLPGRPDLSADDINAELWKDQSTFDTGGVAKTCRVDVNYLESNRPIEDRHFVGTFDRGLLVGIFDGHAGDEAVKLASNVLPSYIGSAIKSSSSIGQALVQAFESFDRHLYNIPKEILPDFERLSANQVSWIDIPAEARKRLLQALSGCCASFAYVKNDKVTVANSGDTRIFIGHRLSEGVYEARDLTDDHQPGNPSELARMRAEHPGEHETVASYHPSEVNGPLRVLGGMMPSRTLGDMKYKWPLAWHEKIDEIVLRRPRITKTSYRTRPNYKTPPYIIPTPEIREYGLNSNDEFMVLVTDGVSEVLTNQQVVDAVGKYLSTTTSRHETAEDGHTIVDSNGATHILRETLGQIGEGEFGPHTLSRMLSLDPKTSRWIRDDITIMVVFFKGSEKHLKNTKKDVRLVIRPTDVSPLPKAKL
ncbi:phosphatase 2C-like domain-containing protein [Polychytrium aggregatum]|uniref:phosphatase 2C-like domain-containing protein n=1 Tax=Polychytrium aggregatum TaxID=110093 RepID=UPI0022FEFE66|nr:phosphatase 2C-like domain-containing protein [Polychytrium aggregatum]KAI9199712.1 phosphatase 2C-like domain-containing protein [Polychytrium aggregatum]